MNIFDAARLPGSVGFGTGYPYSGRLNCYERMGFEKAGGLKNSF